MEAMDFDIEEEGFSHRLQHFIEAGFEAKEDEDAATDTYKRLQTWASAKMEERDKLIKSLKVQQKAFVPITKFSKTRR